MRSIVVFTGVAALCAFAGCTSSKDSGSPQTGGTTETTASGGDNGSGGTGDGSGGSGSGGEVTNSGGVTETGGSGGGNPPSGGVVASGGTRASGGATLTGGVTNSGGKGGSGGAPASGGTTASGGAPVSGGKTGSGGTAGAGGKTDSQGGTVGSGGTTVADYQGPCDVLASGCAEAYGMARAMTTKYTGPLFQLGLAKDTSKTLDVGQTSDRKADLSKWSDFCGGNQSNCVVSKIYGQIQKGSNDMLPAVWKAPWGPDCSAGGYTCAAKFKIETETGLPWLWTDAPQEYAIRNGNTENYSTGINAGKTAMSLMYNGKPVANSVYCCGVFGLAHKYNEPDDYGTDFMVALAYGWRDSGGCCIAVNCGANNKYCVGAEEEENNDLVDYGSSPVDNALVITQFDPTKNAVISFLNGKQMLSHSPPKANLNVKKALHIGGGGDLSQPDPVRMREALVANSIMSSSEVAAVKANVTAFFSALKFPEQ